MKEELIKILNFKLKQIKDNIDDLNKSNEKIEEENNNLKFIQDAINVFKAEEHGFDIYKFSNIERETFNKLLMTLSDDVLTKFGTNSCNYDGLIYLINGINNGISLMLTQEQTDAINLFIDKLLEKEKEEQNIIDNLNEEKQKLEIKDLDVLGELENKYSLIIENIEDKKYVTEIDEIVEAINYSAINGENAFNILCYLLKYNSSVYEENKTVEVKEEVVEKKIEEENKIDLTKPFEIEEVSENTIDLTDTNDENHDEEVTATLVNEEEKEEKEESNIEVEEVHEENVENEQEEANLENADSISALEDEFSKQVDNEEYNPILPSFDSEGYYVGEDNDINLTEINELQDKPIDFIMPSIELDLPVDEEDEFNSLVNYSNNESQLEIEDEKSLETEEISSDNASDVVEIPINPVEMELETNEQDEVKEDLEEEKSAEEQNIDNESNDEMLDKTIDNSELNKENELNNLFEKYNFDYNINDEITKSLLLKGNIEDYVNILEKLDELLVLKHLKNNSELLIQILLYSDLSIINQIVEVVSKDLSVDDDDKEITLEILFKTMPTVFIKGEKGNFDNFINNIELLKKYGIDLINLFDFSREVLIADNKFIANNYEIVRNYDLTLNAYNAKYLLLLPNINEKIDYYVESMYKDNSENGNGELFDGLEMIKLYPAKLNTVCSETIERLRYSSENGLKVFGSKEKSIAGEISNLNVNIINVTEEFKKSLFNNEIDIIARDEVEKYIELTNTNEYVEMNEDELLNKLDGYKVGMRYFIGNIEVSANKVVRNYNILVNNDIDKKKALLFAICYNLVITKTEYERLKSFVNGLGGN